MVSRGIPQPDCLSIEAVSVTAGGEDAKCPASVEVKLFFRRGGGVYSAPAKAGLGGF